MKYRNQKIIDAIIHKAERDCPGALALIGIYGSFLTNETHERSDLDLMILINDERGRILSSTFIQDDETVGHDLYCTTWEMLEQDAQYTHPQLSKLLDSRIVYCSDDVHLTRLENLRARARAAMAGPLDEKGYAKAEVYLNSAMRNYISAMLVRDRESLLSYAGWILRDVESGLMMLNNKYFRKGIRHALEELDALIYKPEGFWEQILKIVTADSTEAVKEALTQLMYSLIATYDLRHYLIGPDGNSREDDISLAGTCEEMYSNWRGKLWLAARERDPHLAFMSLSGADAMLQEISDEADIIPLNPFDDYDSHDLDATARRFDKFLNEYLDEYDRTGIQLKRYPNIDAFIEDYLK